MIFTRRTYRKAIRRSIQAEQELRSRKRSCCIHNTLRNQINHTRRLQARKRKERK